MRYELLDHTIRQIIHPNYHPQDVTHNVYEDIYYDGPSYARGRNGGINTSGLSVQSFNGNVSLRVITSKGTTSPSVEIDIPETAWFGHALHTLLDMHDKQGTLPTLLGLHPLIDLILEQRMKQ
jgi:hypothetical protein